MSGRKRKQTKQLTLACWKKFKVEVEHRGEKVEAKGKTVASSEPKVTCDICKKEFLNNQGLGCHKLKCEKENGMSSTISQLLLAPSRKAPSFIEKDVKMVLECVIDKVERSVGKKQTKQRGASRRESHTVNFKAKVLKELLYSEKKSQ